MSEVKKAKEETTKAWEEEKKRLAPLNLTEEQLLAYKTLWGLELLKKRWSRTK